MVSLFSANSLQAQCTSCTTIPPPFAGCIAPANGYDRDVTVTGRMDWNAVVGLNNEDITQRIRIRGNGGTLVVQNKSINNSTEFYTVYDNAVTEGDNTYRVKATYLDGASSITPPKTLTFTSNHDFRVFPNPTDDILSVDLSTYKEQALSLYLYNAFGQVVLSRTIEKAGNGILDLDVSHLQMGSYRIRLVSKGRKDAVKQISISK